MNWTEYLTAEMEAAYHAVSGLLKFVDNDKLDWKPSQGTNWMTTGQLLKHLETACGFCCNAFITGDWGTPEGTDGGDAMPSAASMPTTPSVAATRAALESDKKLALDAVAQLGEQGLATKKVAAPWNPEPRLFGHQFSHMIEHLQQHKAQLFYYLKMQGHEVNTGHMYGMAP